MLGHALWQTLQHRFDTYVTLRHPVSGRYERLFPAARTRIGVDAMSFDTLLPVLASVRPNVVVNAIGIVKQSPAAHEPIPSLTVNAVFPHRLAAACGAMDARLIHVSTDCVFSGRGGMYREEDTPDADDLYGRGKLLGEVTGLGCLTVRTSIIGHELRGQAGLVEWFLTQEGSTVNGYRRAVFSGFTTLAFSRILADVIERTPDLTGLYHVSSEPINKFDLLTLVRNAYGKNVEVVPDDAVRIDRSLDSSRFRKEVNLRPDSWPAMIAEMAGESFI